jgi:glycine/D-amino acid oxidase-like deaminating enzyme
VIERDPTYSLASTPRASGGVRRLFSLPENIQLSQYSIPFFERFATSMAVDDEPALIGFKKNGYLFIVPPGAHDTLRANFEAQEREGVRVTWLEPSEIAAKFPSMMVDDLGAGVQSPDDGWLDPHSVLQGFRRKARSLGAEFISDEVVGIDVERGLARSVTLKSGISIATDAVINAAGAWAKEICAMVGWTVPIEPMRRYEHYFEAAEPIEPLPYIKDVNRLAFRPEGKGYSGGVPDLAHRFRAFERTKVRSTMSGLYDQNELDANMIIGPWSGRLENFYLLAGFSGHGLMHAPGSGRAIAELILDGGYRTIDLSRFGWRRIADNRPYRERGII